MLRAAVWLEVLNTFLSLNAQIDRTQRYDLEEDPVMARTAYNTSHCVAMQRCISNVTTVSRLQNIVATFRTYATMPHSANGQNLFTC